MTLLKRDICPACERSEFKEIYSLSYNSKKMHFFLNKYYKGLLQIDKLNKYRYRLLECKSCRLIFQEQIPGKEFSKELYENIIDQGDSLLKKDNFEKKWNKKLFYEIKMIENLFKKKSNEISVLEFGAGWGNWAQHLKNKNFNICAFEVSDSRIDYMNKKGIRTLTDINETNKKFDFIYSEETFEHISNPKETLITLSKILNNGGYMLLRFPSHFLFKFRVKQNYKPTADCAHPLEHINLFKKKSFDEMLKNTNLETITFKSKFNWSFRNFLKDLKNLVYFRSILIRKNY